MRILRALVLVSLCLAGGCHVLAEFLVDVAIDAALHDDDDDSPCASPPRPPPHRSPRVLDRTRHR